MGSNIKNTLSRLKIERDPKYLTINKEETTVRVRVPGTDSRSFNRRKYKTVKGMIVDALIYRDKMQKIKNKQSNLILYQEPLKELDLINAIRQSSRKLYTDKLDPSKVDSIYIKGKINGFSIVYKVELLQFQEGNKSRYYHAHYYAVYIRNNSFDKNEEPSVSLEKAAFKWAMNTTKHKYQNISDKEYEQAIAEYKGNI